MSSPLYDDLVIAKERKEKRFAILIDPDKLKLQNLAEIIDGAINAKVDYFFIGGSLIVNNMLDHVISIIKESCSIPCILFPGNSFQLSYSADAILFLSLISGRNSDLLIGHHVLTAPYLKISELEVLATGYMLVDGGTDTTVSYISNTRPIPYQKNDIAISTAMAGEMLGLKCIFMDAGSGAQKSISTNMIQAVSEVIDIPLIIGGGIRSPDEAKEKIDAGADVIVVGNCIEEKPSLISDFAYAIKGAVVTTQ